MIEKFIMRNYLYRFIKILSNQSIALTDLMSCLIALVDVADPQLNSHQK